MRLGIHVKIAQGLSAAVDTAERIGCETIQIFASNPNAWRETAPNPQAAETFRLLTGELDIKPVILHTAYLLNLASKDDLIYSRSVTALTQALNRADLLDAEYVVTHIGSHGGSGYEAGLQRIQHAVRTALSNSSGDRTVLLESGAGAGNTIGSRFEQVADILAGLDDCAGRVGVALDTAHLWGAGYDISQAESVLDTLDDFDRLVGVYRLKLIHFNDTLVDLGCHRDRHWHIGQGKIGLEGFGALVNHPALSGVPGILETPMDEPGWDYKNLSLLKSLRNNLI
jgi:deoxyribonuclease-4